MSSTSWRLFSPFPFGRIDVSTEPLPAMSG
jgi:hypothetical protein